MEHIDERELSSAEWHNELLQRMPLAVEGVRPPILTSELAAALQDYLAFRRFVWYGSVLQLDWSMVKPKAVNLKPTFEKLEIAFQRFFAFLRAASEQLE